MSEELGKNMRNTASISTLNANALVFIPSALAPAVTAGEIAPPFAPASAIANSALDTANPVDEKPTSTADNRVGNPSALAPATTVRKNATTQSHRIGPRPPDELDLLVTKATAALQTSSDWDEFFHSQRDPRGDWGEVKTLDHPAAYLLDVYKRLGVPVLLHTSQWTASRRQAALARGPHKSAKEHVPFLREEYAAMIRKGHWTVLPASKVMKLKNLRLSPLGVVPQRDRRPRTISDYSYFGVNDDTVPLAPQEAMQFGKALRRILQSIHDANPRYGPVRLAKIDIADGFYRIGLRPADALKLAVLFPTKAGEEPLVGIPLTLPMGWKESPPAFCTATETVADLANAALKSGDRTLVRTPHRLDDIAETPPPDAPTVPSPHHTNTSTPVPGESDGRKLQRPIQSWDVYVDDFLGLVQGGKARQTAVKRALLHSLDRVFRPVDAADAEYRQEPASIKKLKKGDGTWATRKVMLGWLIDTVAGTIELPPHRVDRLREILRSIPTHLRVIEVQRWHKILGELRSMSIAIPGARGLFSLLQEAFRHRERDRPRLRLTKAVHTVLNDFRWLAEDVAARPTRIGELIPTEPSIIGACDAAGTGMGGVFFVPPPPNSLDRSPTPFFWRQPFPLAIQRDLVSYTNPRGTINNSDLELCGNVAHHDVVAQTADVRERTVWTGSDNTANVYWLRKGSTTTTGPPAQLLRIQSHHQRLHRYVPVHDYVPGSANAMADLCSRAWHLTDPQLISLLNTTYPQTRSWRPCRLNSAFALTLTSALSKTTSPTEFARKLPKPRMPIGRFGSNFAANTASTHSSVASSIRYLSSKSLPTAIATDGWPPAADAFQLNGFRTSYARWARRSNGWGPLTRENRKVMPSTTVSPSSCAAGVRRIHRPHECARSRSRS